MFSSSVKARPIKKQRLSEALVLNEPNTDDNDDDNGRYHEPKGNFEHLSSRSHEFEHSPAYGELYLDAFMTALDIVLENESYLFDDSELALFEYFQSFDDDSKKLYVRLFLRRTDKWFRLSRLEASYAEIFNICEAGTRLVDSGVFAEDDSVITNVEHMLELLTINELKDLGSDIGIRMKGNKQEIMLCLKKNTKTQSQLNLTNGFVLLSQDGNGQENTQSQGLSHRVRKIIGKTIRLCRPQVDLFERVHLVFSRSHDMNEKALMNFILAKASKRNFAQYMVYRSTDVFASRNELIQYETALKLQSQVDNAFESSSWTKAKLVATRELFDHVKDRWQSCIDDILKSNKQIDHFLIRFTAGYVYTRLMYKHAYILSRLCCHEEAHVVYSLLLDQSVYCRGKRGDWYQKKALIEAMYMWRDIPDQTNKRHWKYISLLTCEQGLQDPDAHLIYHYDLQKRITRLEKELRVLSRDRHVFTHIALKQAQMRTFHGTRVCESGLGKKGVWLGVDGKECSVEGMCLSNYVALGWKGYHTEGGIIRTIFAYLFWDIIFMPIPWVFETTFQDSPLDLRTDAFYINRSLEINRRLSEIESTIGIQYIRAVYEREHERRTRCVGLDWDFPIDDVVEAAECIGGQALSAICKLFCEDYGHRASGMPDLFLWNSHKKKCLFSEVKSLNDRLSDTQRLWIDVLIGAGVEVELCAGLEVEKKDT
ncbi:hypothetical protein V1514DRAFT_335921 [Lipomyces japonicus]|uniref:uncharacterized protein n=1 Tax=Lipomyces japonicus TaxID=56871 RepID=UPI0034CE9689